MDSPTEINPERSLEYIWKHSKAYAKAKAERIYLEEYRKSLKALLMKASDSQSAAMQERDAYAHPNYLKHLEALHAAVEQEEALRWRMVTAQAAVEIWRSQEASNRGMDRGTR